MYTREDTISAILRRTVAHPAINHKRSIAVQIRQWRIAKNTGADAAKKARDSDGLNRIAKVGGVVINENPRARTEPAITVLVFDLRNHSQRSAR
jgi:hypothetical protein